MQSLISQPKVQEDIKRYLERINKLTNEDIKRECQRLLKSLEQEIKAIDIHHAELLRSRTLPNLTEDSRSQILTIRRQLEKKLKDSKV